MRKIKNLLVVGFVFLIIIYSQFTELNKPNVPVFDEAIHATFSLLYAHHLPYFDVHPPLFSTILSKAGNLIKSDLRNIRDQDSRQFGNFPFEKLRNLSGITGLVLILIIMLLSYRFFNSIRSAVVTGMLIVLDPALAIYSNFIFPDIYLLFLGFGSVLVSTYNGILFGIISGIFLGLAVSIKWTGLAFGIISGLLIGRRKIFNHTLLFLVAFLVTYLSVWIIFFRNVDLKKPVYFPYEQYFGKVSLPKSNNFLDIVKFLPEHNLNMFKVTTLLSQHEAASSPWVWPLGKGEIRLYSADEKEIVLKGNMMWFIGMVAVMWSFFISAKKNRPIGFYEIVLIVGYVVSYIPLFFTGRSMFIYHYFSPLIFSYLLIPRAFIVPR